MKKTVKLLVIALSSVVMLIASCICASAYRSNGIASESAKYYESEIPNLEKKLSEREAELKKLKATAQSTDGYEYFYYVNVLSSDPLIIYNDNYFRGPIGYARIYNASLDIISSIYGWSGYAKPLGTYTYYNNKSIPNYQAADIKTNASEISRTENDISNLKNTIADYKKALVGVKKSIIFTLGKDNQTLSATTVRHDMKSGNYHSIAYYFSKDYYDKSKLKWYSSNTKIATVDEYARVRFLKPGEVTITGEYSQTNSKLKIKFIVTDYVDSISIRDNGTSSGELDKGKSLKLDLSIYPSNSTDKIYWVSSNISVATVNNGVVKGVSPGVAYIYAYSKGKVVSNPYKVYVTGKSTKVNYAGNKKMAILCLTQNYKYESPDIYVNEFYTVDEKGDYYVVNTYGTIEDYVAKNYEGRNVSCSSYKYYVRKKDGKIFESIDGKLKKYDTSQLVFY